jgi:hypothetical protein
MDSFMLQDDAARNRIRLAEEFLDPRNVSVSSCQISLTHERMQMILTVEATGQTLF